MNDKLFEVKHQKLMEERDERGLRALEFRELARTVEAQTGESMLIDHIGDVVAHNLD